MEETQLTMVSEANEHRQPHLFRVGDSVFLDTRLLPVGYPMSIPLPTTMSTRESFNIRTPVRLRS